MSEDQRREVVEVIDHSPHTIGSACREIGISRSSYYRWRELVHGPPLVHRERAPWNRLRPEERQAIQQAVERSGLERAPRLERPALLTDNGSGYISRAMRDYLGFHGLKHLRAPTGQGSSSPDHRQGGAMASDHEGRGDAGGAHQPGPAARSDLEIRGLLQPPALP